MSTPTGKPCLNWRLLSFVLVGAGALVFIAANAHLIHIALVSQPDCVERLKAEGNGSVYRAARPSC